MRRRLLGAAAHFCEWRFGWIQVQALCPGSMKRLLAVLSLTTFAAMSAYATTYVRVEKDGTKTYSDRPLAGGHPIEIEPAQTYSPPASTPTTSGLPGEQQLLRDMGDAFRYDSCALTPTADQTFTNPEEVSLGVALQPALRPGDVLELRLDGTPVGGANAMSYVMKPAFRGAHTVSVSVKDQYGRSLCQASSTFHVFQPGLNSPARKPPPRARG
jgi:hypothetical protein